MQLKITSRMARHCGVVIVASVAVMAWTASAAPPTNITTTVASPEDLTAEIRSLLTSVEDALSTAESHEQRQTQLQRQATQIAIFAQALADHAVESPLKQPAPALRDAALALTRAASHKDAIAQLSHMTQALDGKATGAAAKEVEWSRLAGTSAMMAAMKERSEAIRRGLRRPRDPDADSRHALAIALMALVVHSEAHFVEDPIDKPVWQEACLELQGHMSRAAAAIKSRHESAADHFRMGMEVCARCHEKFKP